ncbi:peptidyl-Lys metalloendopeptidase [Rhizoctonia solani]|uniref:Peptidyl-Lys metalloendopeptidase n=1 Tax=Rhizoctonia solani TaxID=456999 RepID=A0A8H8PCN8_9AGAM|nr:peptidyl-Lys metalloendopeptidase [Rhizoctonia solani]QRW27668.1 peptidyl-Lys metalloendopeptidase [Rhizoctonia solani]
MRTAFATALVSAAVLGVSAAPGLSLSIVTPESVADVENLSVTAVVKNTGTETLKLLKDPRGVLSSAKTHTFNVANEKGSPQFTGMFVKYSPDYVVKKNNAADLPSWRLVRPMSSLTILLECTTLPTRCWRIQDASNLFQYVDASGKLASIEASTQSNKVALTGNLVSTRVRPTKIESRSLGKRIAYVGCSTTRQSQIATAVTSANSYVSAATSYLNGISSGTTRYTTWFGTYSSSRASTVRSHFSAIGTDASSTTYDCSTCTSSAYAYVYANQPGRVYLCSAFWSAPNTGTDSRAGTIVHEQSHFTVNGGTQDIVYGQSGARSLASSSPDRAIQNADSHEYFAENNPAQS